MSDIIKVTDKRERQKKKKKKSGASYRESVRAKWSYCTLKLGFLQIICKGSLIFESNLELAFSIILKEKELYESKHVIVECKNLIKMLYQINMLINT